MANGRQRKHSANAKTKELVVITFTDDSEQAKEYQTLLKNSDIPAVIKEQDGFAIMIPEDYIDEAHVVIESQEIYDDFYDFAPEDDDDEFDSGIFEDEI